MITRASRKRVNTALAPRGKGRGEWASVRRRIATLTNEELQEAWEFERLDRNRASVLRQLSAERAKRGLEERRERGGGRSFKE